MTDSSINGGDVNRIETEARIAKLMAETVKLGAETTKLNRETVLYPLVVGSGTTLAIIGIVKLFM
ncbi:hypothetical protein PhaeoP66_03223 [Phaeobacter inhibens]|uniref:Uncharacterized protein n=1 Tax=Phaeobacter inhibens TaxID=221822 RepID=A0ABM6RHN8_9RHOB|nr:hypothetical protein [Phaeobacter inhibens]AUQ95965.1 hypothetical protein PhaeoP66_03223 [Phaeobacter inhibens]